MLRELAWMELAHEPPPDDKQLMDNEQFDAEVALAGAGRWEELGLDPMTDWSPSTIEDLRNA